MHTEEEAKKKWCPMSQISASSIARATRNNYAEGFNCVSSACMLWKWEDEKRSSNPAYCKGYCGLAKK